MSLTTKRIHGQDYLYLQAGRAKTLMLGRANSNDPSDFKTENVKKGIEYVSQRIDNYVEICLKLVSLLPEKERQKYLQGLAKTLESRL